MKSILILAVETSCDDTSIALVKCGGALKNLRFEILENIVSSQIKIHRPFGGVVPNLAKREHLKNLPKILNLISKKHDLKKVDYVAVTVGPGLEPALWTGVNFSLQLADKFKKPLIGINHMEGHLYSNWISGFLKNSKNKKLVKKDKIEFPAVSLIVSGGHTILLYMKSVNKWIKLGETLDDAAGEAFDKVAKMLELPYPGGPEIDKLAKSGDPDKINFPRPMLNRKNYDFSFSGLKTSVLYYLRDHPTVSKEDIAASFQKAVIDVLVKKTIRAAMEFNAKTIMISGGVAANKNLRRSFQEKADSLKIKFLAPELKYNTDNAAMIAAAAYINLISKNHKSLEIKASSDLTI